MPFLIVFVLFPLLELWLLIKVGSAIGAFTTVARTIVTAMAGLALLRLQSLQALASAQRRMNAGEAPVQEVVQGVFLALGGLLLLVPGFITDGLGLLCLTPGIRHWLVAGLLRRVQVRSHHYARANSRGDVIEGESRRE